ncbi:hypothetical protein BH11BAC7_BH11BAC7_32050 [soil metagenome]
MVVLNEQQVSFILYDIKRKGIELEELQLNLLDHICCIIENEMQADQDFGEFYHAIIPRFFKRDLLEIQQETDLLLTFKHYYAMKKVMIGSGILSAITFIAGTFFKFMHLPGASPLLVIAVVSFSLIFLPLVFLLKAKEVKARREKITLSIAASFAILISLSILFKIMLWPGANILSVIALSILFFVFLPVYFFGGIRNADTKTNTIITSILILSTGGLLFMLTSLKPSRQVNFLHYAALQELNESYKYATAQTKMFLAGSDTASTKSKHDFTGLHNSCNELCNKIEAEKNRINEYISAEQDPKQDYEELFYEYATNFDVPNNLLFDHLGNPSAQLIAIKYDIANLKKLVKEKYNKTDVSILNISDSDAHGNPEKEKDSWENAKFHHVPYDLVMTNFTQLQLDVRMIEASCL